MVKKIPRPTNGAVVAWQTALDTNGGNAHDVHIVRTVLKGQYVREEKGNLMTRLAAAKVRQDFAETVNRVAYGRERIVLHRRGKDLAALISLEDLALLEKLEDRLDAEEAEKILAESKAKGEKPIRWEKAKKALRL
jgi:prevent-host-death family protein